MLGYWWAWSGRRVNSVDMVEKEAASGAEFLSIWLGLRQEAWAVTHGFFKAEYMATHVAGVYISWLLCVEVLFWLLQFHPTPRQWNKVISWDWDVEKLLER